MFRIAFNFDEDNTLYASRAEAVEAGAQIVRQCLTAGAENATNGQALAGTFIDGEYDQVLVRGLQINDAEMIVRGYNSAEEGCRGNGMTARGFEIVEVGSIRDLELLAESES